MLADDGALVRQMKNILVPLGGGDSDETVFHTALAVAEPLAGHLRFIHVRMGAAEAARYTPHAAFARGPAIRNTLQYLAADANARSVAAAQRVRALCARSSIAMAEAPRAEDAVTASWQEEEGSAIERLIFHARHSDLVVMARAQRSDGLPPDRLETLLMACGRPLLIAARAAPGSLMGTIAVCWKETAEAARALGTTMPLLRKARQVVFVGVKERDEDVAAALDDLVRQVRWHGVSATARAIAADGRPTSELLAATAKEAGACLMVMGAYGRSRAREVLFGGCTQAALEQADLPVLLVH
jgi:nucleotide-binding universal stress UspA family protein